MVVEYLTQYGRTRCIRCGGEIVKLGSHEASAEWLHATDEHGYGYEKACPGSPVATPDPGWTPRKAGDQRPKVASAAEILADVDEVTAEDYQKKRAALLERGYVDVDEFRGLRVGDRVHNGNQQYVEAYRDGTANILMIATRPKSSWAQKYRRADVEMLVLRDEPTFEGASRVSGWADYHTRKVN